MAIAGEIRVVGMAYYHKTKQLEIKKKKPIFIERQVIGVLRE